MLSALRLFATDKDFLRRGGTDGQEQAARWARPGLRRCSAGGITIWSRADDQPGLYRRGLRHRAGAGVAQFFGQRAGVGLADSAADLFPGAAIAHHAAAGGRGRCRMGRAGLRCLALHRAADRGGRDAVRVDLHAVPHAQVADRGTAPRVR